MAGAADHIGPEDCSLSLWLLSLSEKTIRKWILNKGVMCCDLLFKGQLYFHIENDGRKGGKLRQVLGSS